VDFPASKIITFRSPSWPGNDQGHPDALLLLLTPTEYSSLYKLLGFAEFEPYLNEHDDDGRSPILYRVRSNDISESLIKRFPNSFATWTSDHKLWFIVDTKSGTLDAVWFFDHGIYTLLSTLGKWQSEVWHTQSEDTITQLSEDVFVPFSREPRREPQHIVLLSGDGGVIDVVNAFYRNVRNATDIKKPILTILPFGTGNALSNSLNYTSDDTWGLRTMSQGNYRPLPVFRVTFSPGARLVVNEGKDLKTIPTYSDDETEAQDSSSGKPTMFGVVVCSWGLHAALVADSDTAEYRKFGAERFMMAAKALLYPEGGSGPHPFKGKISLLDPKTKSWDAISRDTHSYVVATMVSYLEKGFMISPDSRKLDGQMRIVEMPPMSGEELMSIITGAYNGGTHVKDRRVGYKDIDGMLIEFGDEEADKWRRVCVDGKIILIEKGGWVRVEKESRELLDVVYKPSIHSDPDTVNGSQNDDFSIRIGNW